jgi:hypothetical protein
VKSAISIPMGSESTPSALACPEKFGPHVRTFRRATPDSTANRPAAPIVPIPLRSDRPIVSITRVSIPLCPGATSGGVNFRSPRAFSRRRSKAERTAPWGSSSY